jgi:hypothetical protein
MKSKQLLKDYGNSYNYSQISSTSIGLCAPQISSATVNSKLDTSIQFSIGKVRFTVPQDSNKTKPLQSNEAGSIRSSFYAQLKRQIMVRSLTWNVLNETLNTTITTQLRINDSLRTAIIPPDLKTELQNAGMSTLIVVYDIQSVHDQHAIYVKGENMIGKIDLEFTYKCAVLDIQNEKVVMFVKMHESSNDPLNFYDQVCESLFNVLLFNGIE